MDPIIIEGTLELSRILGLNYGADRVYLNQQALDTLLRQHTGQAGDTPSLGRVRLTITWLEPLEPSPVGDTDILIDAGLERPSEPTP